jgi:hypothetical protein
VPRLGELLVAAGVIGPAQLEEGLRAQVIHGARLGTNLVELGHVEIDQVAHALARRHQLPPAMRRHFERCDPELLARLPAGLAAIHLVVPIGFLTDGSERVMIACRDPLTPGALAELERAMQLPAGALVPAVCAELRILYFLERCYDVPRSNRFLRVRHSRPSPTEFGEATPTPTRPRPAPAPPVRDDLAADGPPWEDAPAPHEADAELTRDGTGSYRPFEDATGRFRAVPGGDSDAELDLDAALAETATTTAAPFEPGPEFHLEETPIEHVIDGPPPAPPPPPPPRAALPDDAELTPAPVDRPLPLGGEELRRFVETIDRGTVQVTPTLGRIALRKVALRGADAILVEPPPGDAPPPATLADAARAIRRGTSRDLVGDLAARALRTFGGDALTCGILFVVREDVAIGWKGFIAGVDDPALEQLAIPLAAPTVLGAAAREHRALLIDGASGGELDRRLWRALGHPAPGQVAVAPVVLADHTVCLVYGQAASMAPFAELFAAVTQATTSAFARLLRAAHR